MHKSYMPGESSVYFAGIRFDHTDLDTLAEYLLSRAGEFTMVVTPNVDHIVRADKRPELKALYNSAEISVNDSRVLKLLAPLAKKKLGKVVPGSDLTKRIIERISGQDVPITVIGGNEDTIVAVCKRYDLTRVSHYNPPMGFVNDPVEIEKCVRFILDNESSFIFLAVGSPQQEIVARKAKEAGATGTALCIGASLLFLSGEERRAPLLFQKLSLEWLYRLMQSPRRLAKRYFHDALGIIPILRKEGKGIL